MPGLPPPATGLKAIADSTDWVEPTFQKVAIWWIFSGFAEVAFHLIAGVGRTDGGTLIAALVPGLIGVLLGGWMYFRFPILRIVAPYLTGLKIFFSLLAFVPTLALAISGPKVGIPAVLVHFLNLVAGGLTFYFLNTWGDFILGSDDVPD